MSEGKFLDELVNSGTDHPERSLYAAGMLIVIAAVAWRFTNVWCLAIAALAALFSLALVARAIKAWERKRRLDGHRMVEDLKKMSWRDFEFLVADMFRRQGYDVQEGAGQSDGGVDITLRRRDGQKILVQCKQWTAWSVGPAPVREFFGVMTDRKLPGIFVTCGKYTQEARRFAQGKMELIDGERLSREIRAVNGSFRAAGEGVPLPPVEAVGEGPACPRCGSSMVQRTARRGAKAGKCFWGCSTYPECQGTRSA